jgi:curved DNA-binding protein CbpA
MQPDVDDDDQELRTLLNLPRKGALDPSQITASFRTLAKTAHPDAGGSADQYRRIAAARDALLRQFGRTS